MKLNLEKINAWFEKMGRKIVKHRWLYLGLWLGVLVFSMAGISQLKTNHSLDNWFLDGDPAKEATEKFRSIFGNDQYVGILLKSDDVFKSESLQLIRDLSNELLDSVPFAESVNSITESELSEGNEWGIDVGPIIPDMIPTAQEEINAIKEKVLDKDLFVNRLVSEDGKETFVALKLAPYPEDWSSKYEQMPMLMVGEKVTAIINKDKYQSFAPQATGIPVINHGITQFMGVETSKITGLALLLSILVSVFLLKSFRGSVLPLIISVSAIMIMMGVLGWSQYLFEPTFATMPMVLGIAVSICYSVHYFSFFKRKFKATGKRKEAVIYAMKETGWPVLFTAATTIGALLTFLLIPISFIWFVGISTALVVFASYITMVVLMPIVLSFGKDKAPAMNETPKVSWFEKQLGNLSTWILGHSRVILGSYVAIVLLLIYGMTQIEVATDWNKTYGRQIPSLNMALGVAESDIGSLYSYDLTIEFPEVDAAKNPDNLKKLDQLSVEAMNYNLTKRTNALTNYVKDLNMVLNENKEEHYKIPDTQEEVAQLLYLYESAGGVEVEQWIDYEYKFLRMLVDMDYFNSTLAKSDIQRVESRAKELFPTAEVTVVGTVPQSLTLEHYLVTSQLKSMLYAILVISILLTLVFGNFKIGLIGLIPNLAPCLAVGGIMGFAGIPLDLVTVTLIPMILGLAVDDTIHFINHAKLEFIRNGNYTISINRTFRLVGVPLLFTTLILSANFLTNTISAVNMLVNMGVMAFIGIVAALLADYFVTPILFKRFKIFGEETNFEETTLETTPEKKVLDTV